MKGFIKILEAVIASLILLSSITYFFVPLTYSKWNNALLQTRAEDSLAVIYKNGSLEMFIKNGENENLTDLLRSVIPKTDDFSVEINGIANPLIHIGCDCSDKEKTDLQGVLSPTSFRYNDRSIEIIITNGSVDYLINSNVDILFFFGYRAFSDSDEEKLKTFLGNGKSIFILANLTSAQINDGFMNETFGLKASSESGTPTNNVFYTTTDASRTSFRIARYFYWLGGSGFVFNKQSNLNNVMIDNSTVIKTDDNKFSTVKVNYNIINNSKGRTVWFSDYNYGYGSINNLTKAMIMWASGEKFGMDPYTKNAPADHASFVYRHLCVLGSEPFEIDLTVWRIFY
ncbi:MAG: hypothetical protein V1900_02495 [Candidatus Aenigmatarchaeota archaeon]